MTTPTRTADRVIRHTADHVNARIRAQTRFDLEAAAAGGPTAIDERLRALDREWDIERCLETSAATFSLLGVALGAGGDRRWFALPAAVAGFLLQHALQGWCPPLPLFRRLGVRTADEINEERMALKALRGDFQTLADREGTNPTAWLNAVRH